jgi:hypothetical protein
MDLDLVKRLAGGTKVLVKDQAIKKEHGSKVAKCP